MISIAIIQARMSSTRFPGKVMQNVYGKPLLWHLVKRLKLSKKVNKIVIATSTNKVDSKIANFARKNFIDCFRGDENDVLSRFYNVASKYNPNYVVRITADCPLIDPKHIDLLINRVISDKLDYACLGQTFAEGSDIAVFTFKALKESHHESSEQSEKEHVTVYINQNSKFKRLILENSRDDSQFRYTVDVPLDLQVVKAILNHFSKTKKLDFSYEDIIEYLKKSPQISQINQNIVRNEGYLKSLSNESSPTRKRYVLLRVDGSKQVGWGHIMRCIGLAEELKNINVIAVFIVKNEEELLIKKIVSAGYKLELLPKDISFSQDSKKINDLASKYKSQSIIIDLTNKITLKKVNSFRKFVSALRKKIKHITLIDGLKSECLISKINLPVSIAIVPYVGAKSEEYLRQKNTSYLLGVEYCVIRSEFTKANSIKLMSGKTNNILILPGGTDNPQFLSKIIHSFSYLKNKSLHIKILTNHLNLSNKSPHSQSTSYKFEVITNNDSIAHLYKWADIAVSASGLTMYELAYMGIPALIISNNPAHKTIVDNFLHAGTIIHLGSVQSISARKIASEIDNLIINDTKRANMSHNGKMLVDGKGAKRIVARIITKELL